MGSNKYLGTNHGRNKYLGTNHGRNKYLGCAPQNFQKSMGNKIWKWRGNDVEMTWKWRGLGHWSTDPLIFKAVNVLGGKYGKYGEQYWFKWHWFFWQGALHFYNWGVQRTKRVGDKIGIFLQRQILDKSLDKYLTNL